MLDELHNEPDLEEKGGTFADPDPELFALLVGIPLGSFAITNAAALTVPAVACAVRVISEACATLDVTVQRRDGTVWKDDPEHVAGKLLRGDVNDWLSGFEFIRDLAAQALTDDDGGIAWVGRGDGKPQEIIHFKPKTITVSYADTGEPTFKRGEKKLDARDIIHLRSPFTKSPLSLARDAIGAAKEMERHAGNLFRNGAKPGGTIEVPGTMGDPAIARLKASWRAAHEGGANAGRTPVLFGGAKFSPMTLTSTDAEFLANRRFQIEEVARAFRVPLGLLYEMTRQTWSNMEQATREFLIFCLEPWLRALEAALGRALIAAEDRGTFRIHFDRDDLTRASLTERATAINSLRASEVLSADEGRDWLDLPPRTDGQGGSYVNPNINQKPAAAGAAG